MTDLGLLGSGLGSQGWASDTTVNFIPARSRHRFPLFEALWRLPEQEPEPAPRTQVLTMTLRRQTGWSQRRLATVLRSTHPTVRALEEGRSSAPHHDLYNQLVGVHEVVDRVFVLAGRDAGEVDRLLSTTPPLGRSAVDLLAVGDFAGAFLAALDVLRPRRTTSTMRGRWASRPGTATHSLEADGPR